MNNQTKFTIIGWAGFVIMLVLFFQKCGCSECPGVVTTSDTVIFEKWDSVPKNIPVPYAQLVPGDSIKVPVRVSVDTAAILERFFTVFYYSNTYADSNEVLTINDTVSRNRIIGRSLQYKWLKPMTHTTIINKPTEVAKPIRSLYAGVFAGANTNGASAGFGAQISFLTKKQTIYDARFDVLQRRVELGASFKIKFRGRN